MAELIKVSEQLKLMFRAGVFDVPIAIIGSTGIGKSAVVKGVCKELSKELGEEVMCVDLRLSQMSDAADLVGLPRTNPETLETVYCKPDWWPKEGTKGILFLDEPNRGAPDVQQGVFQLLTDQRIHTHKLPPGWMIVMAMNPASGDITYTVNQMDAAWNSRYLWLEASASADGWLSWARENNINDLIIRFVGLHQELLHKVAEDGPFPTPRTWEMLSKLLNAKAVVKDIEADLIRGLIGIVAATDLIKFMDKGYNKPVSGKQVLEGEKVERCDENGVSKQMPVIEAVKHQRNDETMATITDIVSLVGSYKFSDKAHKNLAAFCKAIPKEAGFSLLKKLPSNLVKVLGDADEELMNMVISMLKEMKASK
jgi:ABC-type cobalamin/Fe3+-siderophores transport system ATPase subunit